MQRGVRLDHRFGLGEEVGHLGRVGRHAAAPAAPATGAPSRRRPIATTAMTRSGTLTADSTTLAIICPSIRSPICRTSYQPMVMKISVSTIWLTAAGMKRRSGRDRQRHEYGTGD